jgi:hypothetical protein
LQIDFGGSTLLLACLLLSFLVFLIDDLCYLSFFLNLYIFGDDLFLFGVILFLVGMNWRIGHFSDFHYLVPELFLLFCSRLYFQSDAYLFSGNAFSL